MYDPLTLAVVMDPSFCEYRDMYCDFERFNNHDYPYLVDDPQEPQVSVAVDVNVERFEAWLAERLAAPVLPKEAS